MPFINLKVGSLVANMSKIVTLEEFRYKTIPSLWTYNFGYLSVGNIERVSVSARDVEDVEINPISNSLFLLLNHRKHFAMEQYVIL